jgi:hypothetical protein
MAYIGNGPARGDLLHAGSLSERLSWRNGIAGCPLEHHTATTTTQGYLFGALPGQSERFPGRVRQQKVHLGAI